MRDFAGVLFILLLGLAAIAFLLHWMLLSRLRSHHESLWIRLGSPATVQNNSIANSIALGAFLRQQACLETGDRPLIRLCEVIRVFKLVYHPVLLLTVVVITLVILGH
jgi:hypothetical protein